MSKRVKVIKQIIETREEMERIIGEIAQLVIDQSAVKDELDGRLLEIRAQYETRLTELADAIDAKLPIAQDWAERNREAFGNKKSIEGVHAVFGFRTGTPKLKTLAGWTWDSVKAWLINHNEPYTRTEVAINKEAIITDREILGENGLKKMGIRVVQDEIFFVDPKRESAPEIGKE